ncbi:MAG: sugar ABC transporter ATP-binding protein [Propionibacteriaceae bacterium]|jgi:methyl-galactoside transport system ATP-binding protein|nr:sugar ABC transporter ATP-binding protein [Propionibacteriaceae bacterium]
MTDTLLQMNHITKTFPGVVALDDVSLTVERGTVHALMGENGAGKSTLMKCLFGIYREDSGEILLDAHPVVINSAKQALDLGISMIHQEPHPVRFRSVAENVWLGRFPQLIPGVVNHRKMREMTQELFKRVDLDIDPDTTAGELSASVFQLVEIAKAISYDAKIIIMDEPTSSLTEAEVGHLFEIINRLRDEGIAIIYISHKMEEILKIADEVTIMRDGKRVGTWPASELTTDLIINRMVGRELTNRFPPRHERRSDEVVLKVEGLTATSPRSFTDVSFELRKGEILGIGGLVGAQRTELVEAIFGLRGIASGTIYKDGQVIRNDSPKTSKKHGIALLTEERRATGIIPMLSVCDNTVIANARRYARGFVISEVQRHEAAEQEVRDLRIKTPSTDTEIADLSGGNQQKVLVGRWLLTDPEILILDEPTRGIDVGAKYEIYTLIQNLTRQGKSIIMISSEMPELLGVSDRIMVMCEGRVAGFLNDPSEFSQVEVMRLATSFMTQQSEKEAA